MTTQEDREQQQRIARERREEHQRREHHEQQVSSALSASNHAFEGPLKALRTLNEMFRENRTRLTADETRTFDTVADLLQQSIDAYRREIVAMSYPGCICPVCQPMKRYADRLERVSKR
ncbi:MAG: hypothetical protein OXC99_12230 [Chloroflexi bacterium]|nr:hypothetical protein [Chloroflexota bacterium]